MSFSPRSLTFHTKTALTEQYWVEIGFQVSVKDTSPLNITITEIKDTSKVIRLCHSPELPSAEPDAPELDELHVSKYGGSSHHKMFVEFKNNRLLVGIRARNWHPVWFEPSETEAIDGTEAGKRTKRTKKEQNYFYTSNTGEDVLKAPMKGEIHWSPYYDVALCESKIWSEKQEMQWDFLTDAHKYLSEKDPATVKIMEHDLEQPGFSRWQAFFKEAKQWKHRQLRACARKAAKKSGATDAEAEKAANEEISDDDSTYDSEDEQLHDQRRHSSDGMPPPSRGPNKKRAGGSNGADPGAKRSRSSIDTYFSGDQRQRPQTPYMSGALGRQSSSVGSSQLGSINGSVNGDDHQESPLFEPELPNMPTFGIGAHDMNNIPSPLGRRRRGESRVDSTYSDQQPHDQLSNDGNSINGRSDPLDSKEDVERRIRLLQHNGDGMSEDEAYEQATRASMSVQLNGEGMGEDEAYERAIRESMPPEINQPDVQQSIEGDNRDGQE